MHLSRHRPDLALAVVLATALVFAGCVKQDAPGMDVVALDANIVFGIEEAPPAADPVGFVAPPIEQFTPEQLEELPEAPPLPQPLALPPRPAPPKFACPTAGLGEFPESAPVDVSTQPQEGTYKWRPGPPTAFGTDHFEVTEDAFFDRVVFNVSAVTETVNPSTVADDAPVTTRTFTYQVATYSKTSIVLDTYRVVSGGVTAGVNTPVNVGPTAYSGQPDRGVSLVSRQVIEDNRVVAAFNPSTPVLLLPLPAITGATFQSVSYDPVYGTTYMLYGEVKERARVDACGKEVDGWQVVAQTALRDPRDGTVAAPRTANLTYFIATGLGGLISHEGRDNVQLPRFPVNGTPLDGALPPNPEVPDSGANAEPYSFSLAAREPGPISKPVPKPSGLLGND